MHLAPQHPHSATHVPADLIVRGYLEQNAHVHASMVSALSMSGLSVAGGAAPQPQASAADQPVASLPAQQLGVSAAVARDPHTCSTPPLIPPLQALNMSHIPPVSAPTQVPASAAPTAPTAASASNAALARQLLQGLSAPRRGQGEGEGDSASLPRARGGSGGERGDLQLPPTPTSGVLPSLGTIVSRASGGSDIFPLGPSPGPLHAGPAPIPHFLRSRAGSEASSESRLSGGGSWAAGAGSLVRNMGPGPLATPFHSAGDVAAPRARGHSFGLGIMSASVDGEEGGGREAFGALDSADSDVGHFPRPGPQPSLPFMRHSTAVAAAAARGGGMGGLLRQEMRGRKRQLSGGGGSVLDGAPPSSPLLGAAGVTYVSTAGLGLGPGAVSAGFPPTAATQPHPMPALPPGPAPDARYSLRHNVPTSVTGSHPLVQQPAPAPGHPSSFAAPGQRGAAPQPPPHAAAGYAPFWGDLVANVTPAGPQPMALRQPAPQPYQAAQGTPVSREPPPPTPPTQAPGLPSAPAWPTSAGGPTTSGVSRPHSSAPGGARAAGGGSSTLPVSTAPFHAGTRRATLERFYAKRLTRVWKKKVKYGVRKDFADQRMRVRGRFVRKEDEEMLREVVQLT